MKRSLVFVLVFAMLVAAVASAQARKSAPSLKGSRIGLEFGNPAAVIIYRPAPLDFKLGYNFIEGSEYLFLSADYRIISGYQLIDFLHLFLSVGGYGAFYFEDRGDGEGQFDLGARIPVGLQAFLAGSTLEIFVEVAPTVRFFPAIEAFRDFQGYVGFTILLK